jgi:hypothetical protein
LYVGDRGYDKVVAALSELEEFRYSAGVINQEYDVVRYLINIEDVSSKRTFR